MVLLRDVVVVAIDDFFLGSKRGHEAGIVNRLDDRLQQQKSISLTVVEALTPLVRAQSLADAVLRLAQAGLKRTAAHQA